MARPARRRAGVRRHARARRRAGPAGPRSIDLRPDAAARLGLGESIGVVGARERWRLRAPPVTASCASAAGSCSAGAKHALEPLRGARAPAALLQYRGVRLAPARRRHHGLRCLPLAPAAPARMGLARAAGEASARAAGADSASDTACSRVKERASAPGAPLRAQRVGVDERRRRRPPFQRGSERRGCERDQKTRRSPPCRAAREQGGGSRSPNSAIAAARLAKRRRRQRTERGEHAAVAAAGGRSLPRVARKRGERRPGRR